MAGYPVINASGVDVPNIDGTTTHYDLGDVVPLSKLISRRYSWMVERGLLSEDFAEVFDSTSISGDLEVSGNIGIGTAPSFPFHIVKGNNSLRFANGGSSVTPQLSLGTSGGKSVGLLAGTSGTAFIYDSTGSFNITTDTKANIDAGTSTGGTVRFSINSAGAASFAGTLAVTGATTLSGTLTQNSTTATFNSATSHFLNVIGAEYGVVTVSAGSGYTAGIEFRQLGSSRWQWFKSEQTESGSNAGSNLRLYSYNDAGGYLGNPITVTRSTGAISLAGPLTVGSGGSSITGNSTNSGNFTITNTTTTARVSASSGMSTLSIEGPAGQWRELVFKTGTSARWSWDVSTAAESGSNAGSNLALYRYNDAGGSIGTPILVDRATGLTTLSSLTVSGATTLSSFTSSSTATLSGSTTISGSFNIGAYNALPTLGAELGDGVSMTQTVATTIGTYYYVTATTLSACTISPAGSAGETSLTIQANRTAFIATAASHTLTGTGTGFLSVKAITAASTAAGTFVGQAIRSSAQANLGVGADALARNFTNYTTAIGHQALQKNVTGYGNIALGYYALGENITGTSNTSVGYGAIGSLKTGGGNNAFGYQALGNSVVGSGSNAFGYYAGFYQTGSYNLSMGYNAGLGSSGTTTGSYNTFVGGSNTGRAFTSGSYNLMLGSYAGYTGTTGTVDGSVAIGTDSSGTGAQVAASNTIVLGTTTHTTQVPGTTDSSSTTTGTLRVAGGVGIAKALYVGTDANVAGTIEASDVRAISQVMGAF